MTERKLCSACNLEKPLEDFSPNGGGHRGRCRRCEAGACAERRRVASVEVDARTLEELTKHGDKLAQFGTSYQREAAAALVSAGSVEEAASELGITPARLRAQLSELQRRAAERGWHPASDMTRTVPLGFSVKGVSTYYGADGGVRGQWVKSKKEPTEEYQALLDAIERAAAPWRGAIDPTPTPTHLSDDLLSVYPMGDPHLGMYAWHRESGQDFDLAIAERDLCGAVDKLVDLSPPSRTGLLLNLGDFFHADNAQGTTTAGTRVDVDGRWSKLIDVGVRAMRRNIDRGLEKHERMHVICEIGNHDSHSAIMLAKMLSYLYEREPRVTVDTSPANVHWFRFGKVLIASTHGDMIKSSDLLGVMANDRPMDWGETLHRYFYLGHVHHDSAKEYPGMIAETFRTLAAKDKWHASMGYRSGRDMKLDVMHREHGRICRHIVGINQIAPKE